MKKFKLMLVAFMAMVGVNAMAEDDVLVVKDGLNYKVATQPVTGATPAPGTVTVNGVAANTKGNAIKTAKAISIPKSITVVIDDEDKIYNVIGIEDGWETKAEDGKIQNLSEVIETLTIDATNFTTALAKEDFDKFTKLATLTIKDETVPTTEKPAVTTALPEIPGTVATLDFENTNITSMGDVTFTGEKLTSVKLSKALKIIPKDAFKDCTKLAGTIKIPATVTIIATDAFNGDVLADFDFSGAAALTNIRANAFRGTGITKLALGNCAAAFEGTAITASNLPASVTSLGASAFAGCEELTTLSAMAGLTKIPASAFAGDAKLASVSINENVDEIGASAFAGCKALATVTIKTDKDGESALVTIGNLAFAGCEALESIDLGATQITMINGLANAQILGCKALKEVNVPATLTDIGAQAFGDCVIEDLDLSETGITSLKAIFRYADGTYPTAKKPYASLKSIKLPEGLTKIFDYSASDAGVFQYCTGLTEITIPEGVTEVYPYTFQYCTALETATVSDGQVDAKAFWYCDKLKTFNYLDTDVTNDETVGVLNDAFLGCTPFIKFVTTGTYQKAHPTAPTNAKYGTSANAKMKTVAEATGGSKAYGYFWNQATDVDVVVPKADDLKLFSVYVDEGTAYFQALRTYGGKYIIASDDKVIIKTDAPKEIEYTTQPASTKSSVLVDEIVALKADQALADFQSTYPVKAGEYVYRLTNNASTGGFGFTFFTGTTMKAGQFFIISTKTPAAGARLQTVWLDEDGNVEGDATGIQQVDAAQAQDGAIYNLQGVRVNAAKKGLYIQNGKKFIVK